MSPEPALTKAIADAVAAYPKRTVPLRSVLTAAASVDHTAAASVGWRARVLVAINALADSGRVTLPRTRMDRSAMPPLPVYLLRTEAPKNQRVVDGPVVWHADLDWVALAGDAGLVSAAERRFLKAINAWLPRRRGVVVPVRERSLEIFGDEKELEGWILGPLFGPGRLSVRLLECEPCWPPVDQRVFGTGDWLLVENYTTYVSVGRAAERHGFSGRIVWGSGLQVGTRLLTLAAAGEHPTRCWYFGDIDAGGFRAARLAEERARELGLGPVAPARGLYRLALVHGKDRLTRGSARAGQELVRWIHGWFGPTLGEPVAAIAGAGDRIVQENVGTEVLAALTIADWFGH